MNDEIFKGNDAIKLAVGLVYVWGNESIDETIKYVHEMVTRVSTNPLCNEAFRLDIARNVLATKKCSHNATDIKRIAEELRDIANSLDEKAKQVRTSESL